MTCAHLCLLNQLCNLLDALPEDVALRLRRAPLPEGELGAVDFDATEVVISTTATTPQFRAALAHEIVHLVNGAPLAGDVDAEEVRVHETAARLLVPRDHLPAILAAADPHQVADQLVVDLHTAKVGIAAAMADELLAVANEGAA